MKQRYCIDLTNYERFPARIVKIGNIPVGGNYPVRLQSMTNTNTMDINATADQCKRIFDAGADFVRITAPGVKEAEFLRQIKKSLHASGYKNPLIADVHFNPKAAEIAAEIVEKVRINPGNYVDPRAKFKKQSISEEEYDLELERMHSKLLPLIKICKEHGTAIRIGSNYGSLSDRIMNRYGNTPEGMVEAAMEFYHIFRAESFDKLILSMKASNPRVMVEASRLLNARMMEEGLCFPQHMGVTEAGEGKEGRMRSAVGIGALLADGIGHTIRVSLTEAPEKEIPVAQALVDVFQKKKTGITRLPIYAPEYDTFDGADRSKLPDLFDKPVVAADLRGLKKPSENTLEALHFSFDEDEQTWKPGQCSPEMLIVKPHSISGLSIEAFILCENADPKLSCGYASLVKSKHLNHKSNPDVIECVYDALDERELEEILNKDNPAVLLNTHSDHPAGEVRSFMSRLLNHVENTPILLKLDRKIKNDVILAAEYGAVLVENRMAGVVYEPDETNIREKNDTTFELLQAAGIRRSKVEFISCPGCGRTLFDLEKTTGIIKKEFGHLNGLKIAVMGCIVNGPGEMLDADYGYVGSGKGQISLFKGQTPVMKNIPEDRAVEAMKTLLKEHNDWKEP
jgi:(E)-4-hydroxy-3-methylbut-2-enyl-diphosphate synthase